MLRLHETRIGVRYFGVDRNSIGKSSIRFIGDINPILKNRWSSSKPCNPTYYTTQNTALNTEINTTIRIETTSSDDEITLSNELLSDQLTPFNKSILTNHTPIFHNIVEKINSSSSIPNQRTYELCILYSLLLNDAATASKNMDSLAAANFKLADKHSMKYLNVLVTLVKLDKAIEYLRSIRVGIIESNVLVKLLDLVISEGNDDTILAFTAELERLGFIALKAADKNMKENRILITKTPAPSFMDQIFEDMNTQIDEANRNDDIFQNNCHNTDRSFEIHTEDHNAIDESFLNNLPQNELFSMKINRLIKDKISANDDHIALKIFNWSSLVGLKNSQLSHTLLRARLQEIKKEAMICHPCSRFFGSYFLRADAKLALLGPFYSH